jgi:hypothetical protein
VLIEVKDDPLSLLPTFPLIFFNLVPSSSLASPFSVLLSVLFKKKKVYYELCDDVSNTLTEDKIEKYMDLSLPLTPSQRLTKNNKIISIMKKEKDPFKFKFHYIKNRIKHLKDKKQHVADK